MPLLRGRINWFVRLVAIVCEANRVTLVCVVGLSMWEGGGDLRGCGRDLLLVDGLLLWGLMVGGVLVTIVKVVFGGLLILLWLTLVGS